MNTQSLNDVCEFHRFVGEKVNNGGASLSPEEVLDEWRTLHPDSETAQEEIAAIQQAIDDIEKGDKGIPFAEFDRDFRERHNLPAKS